MNPKLFGLLCTIAATALSQMANACGGSAPEDTPTPAPKKSKAPAAKVEPEPEEEETNFPGDVDDPTEETVDVDALRKEALAICRKIYPLAEGNKKKVRAILDSVGEANIGDASDANVPKILAALKKIK